MSDFWKKNDIDTVRKKYLTIKTVKELSNWLYKEENYNYDLIQESSSMWPIDYSQITSHPLNLKSFSFQKIANLKSLDFTDTFKKIINDFKNINIYNLTVADWRKHSNEQKFLIEKGFDRETHSVHVTVDNYPLVHSISKLFEFDYFSIALQYQPPGSVLPRHVDFLGSMWAQFKEQDLDIMNLPFDPVTKSPAGYYAHRCMIALTDWYPGQIFGFENQYWTDWKCGDVITFDWAHARHYTANASLAPRLYIKISGITKNKNHWIFENLNNNTISNI